MYYNILIPQIIFIINDFDKKPSLDYIIAVTQLLAYLFPCIVLSHILILQLTTTLCFVFPLA